jgi:hypothetical protein
VFGHSHIKKEETFDNGAYYNLGTWLKVPYYGKFSNGKFEIIEWKK